MLMAARIVLFVLAVFMTVPAVAVCVPFDSTFELDFSGKDIATSLSDEGEQADDIYDAIVTYKLSAWPIGALHYSRMPDMRTVESFLLWRPPMTVHL